jgi:hypothetical protein
MLTEGNESECKDREEMQYFRVGAICCIALSNSYLAAF